MKETIYLVLKGIIIGLGKIIPGVSGAVLAISLNVYDKGLNALINFFDDPKKNFKFLFKIGIGILISIILFSKLIIIMLNTNYVLTMLLFIGLIIDGTTDLFDQTNMKKNYPYILIFALIIILLKIITIENTNLNPSFLEIVLAGFIDAFATVVPGISGTSLLIITGYYEIVITSLSNLANISHILNNINILLPLLIGMILGIFIISKMVTICFKKDKDKTYACIIGLSLSTTLLLILEVGNKISSFKELIIGIFFFILGSVISNIINKK